MRARLYFYRAEGTAAGDASAYRSPQKATVVTYMILTMRY